jgi:hypothetical protein
VEILADTYGTNLVEHFRGDPELTDWLDEHWQREEVQHGRAIKMYVQAVWPEFDWDAAYSTFLSQYASLCTVEQLEPHKALELISRCVIETGTSSFYRALQHYVREPVLCGLIDNIKTDEAAHYSQFRRYFNVYNAVERHGAGAVIATIWRRLTEIRGEDAYIAFKTAYAARHPTQPFRESDWHNFSRTVRRLARRHYPYLMAVRMLIKPIPLYEPLKKLLQWPLVGLAICISIA